MKRLLACIAAALAVASAGAAGTDGPMSSSRPASAAAFDVNKLFANTCGWCHSNGGRAPGKGPQLMGTKLTDEEIVHRIKNGKQGAMPAFGAQFDDAQIAAIVKYIRELKPEGAAQ